MILDMSNQLDRDTQFLDETLTKKLLPNALSDRQREAFTDLAISDLQGKVTVRKTSVIKDTKGEDLENKLVSEDKVVHEANWVIMVATKVEFETCIAHLGSCSTKESIVEIGTTSIRGRLYDYEYQKGGESHSKKIYLQRTTEQGANSSSNLVQRVCNLVPSPEACFLVGSCGAIPTKKLKLLDVIVPTTALDGQKFSIVGGEINPEPGYSFDRHASISNLVSGLVVSDFDLPAVVNVETDKQIITSIGKWDSLDSNVVDALLYGGENIVAVEMEGVGLVDGIKRSQELSSNIIFGISKGAADYCSIDQLTDQQISDLSSTWPEAEWPEIRPTSDPHIKLELQAEAVRRALVVALKILEKLSN